MSIRLRMLKTVERFRARSGPDFADIRVNRLTIRTRTWFGPRIGDGTAVDSDLEIPAHYPIRYMSEQEIFSSSGSYEFGDVLVDHITPSDGAGVGYTPDQLRPVITTNNVELLYIITGTHAGEYRCIDVRAYRAFTTQLVLRRTGVTP